MKYDTKNTYGKRMVKEAKIARIGQGGGATYTGGDGIKVDNTNMEISVKSTVAMKSDLTDYELKSEAFSGDYDDLTNKPTIPDEVSGTNDGTNWTSLTIGEDTYDIPQGGGSTKRELVLGYKPQQSLPQSGATIADLIAAGAPVISGTTIVVNGDTVYDHTTDADTTDVYFDGFVVMQRGGSGTLDGIVVGNFNAVSDYNSNTFRTKVKLLTMPSSGFTLQGSMRFQVTPETSLRNDYVYGIGASSYTDYRINFSKNGENYAIPYVNSQQVSLSEINSKVLTGSVTEPSLYNRFSNFPTNSSYNGLYVIGNNVNNGKGVMEWKFLVDELGGILSPVAFIGEPDTSTDGTYVLKATVSNGEVLGYQWVLEQ